MCPQDPPARVGPLHMGRKPAPHVRTIVYTDVQFCEHSGWPRIATAGVRSTVHRCEVGSRVSSHTPWAPVGFTVWSFPYRGSPLNDSCSWIRSWCNWTASRSSPLAMNNLNNSARVPTVCAHHQRVSLGPNQANGNCVSVLATCTEDTDTHTRLRSPGCPRCKSARPHV